MHKQAALIVILMVCMVISCKPSYEKNKGQPIDSGVNLLYPKGEKIMNDHFSGTAWLQSLVVSDSINHIAVGSVTFEPGARTIWHLHPDGQIILALSGVGYYQEKGSEKKILRKGDVVTCPPDIPHWHGASPDQEFIQVAITSRLKGPTEWLQEVSDEEYLAGEK